jgi:hypothetical protein
MTEPRDLRFPWVRYRCARYIIAAMKDSEIIFAVEESPEGGYEAHALGHAIFTQADSMDELRDMVRDAVRCHFEEDSIPAVIRLSFTSN